jgi:hypothetical protein
MLSIPDVLPLHISAQNAIVIFRAVSADCMSFEAFEASLEAEKVVNARGKIVMQFPSGPRLMVPREEDNYVALANTLAYLSSNELPDAVPITHKGDSCHQEIRDTTNPRYITEGLANIIGGLQPEDLLPISTPYIHKRLDDHVLWNRAYKPWRRSPLWLLARVTLQSTMSEWDLSGPQGYKAFMSFLMAHVLSQTLDKDHQRFTCDILHHMNTKLARRLCKLGRHVENEHNGTLRIAGDIVYRVSSRLEERWEHIQKEIASKYRWIPPSPSMSEGCLSITFPNSNPYLLEVMERMDSLIKCHKTWDIEEINSTIRSTCSLRPALSSKQLPNPIQIQQKDISLFEFEYWVQEYLEKWSSSPSRKVEDALGLVKVLSQYRTSASEHYKDNPERLSLMHLCIIELWMALDVIVSNWCPLLLRYSPEIPEDFLDPLLLPYFDQVKRLHKVQDYLKRRNKNAEKGWSVFNDINRPDSFANRYFDSSVGLSKLLQRIHSDAIRKRSQTLRRMEELNISYHRLMEKSNRLKCNHPHKQNTPRQITKNCEKCKIEQSARKLRILPFETPLPDSIHKAKAIVFELNCPQPFALWRDSIMDILFPPQSSSNDHKVELYALNEYEPLRNYFKPPYSGFRTSLASSLKSLARSHYGKRRKLPAKEEEVILGYAGRFRLYDASSEDWLGRIDMQNLRPQCTPKLEGPYLTLFPYIKDVIHQPNEVLASQHLCPTEIALDEYLTFGLIRCGNRLQWRNIMRSIRARSLTFSEDAVYSLLTQTIWQAGPLGEGDPHREAHQDLCDEYFCNEALEEISSSAKSIGANWTETLYLAILIFLTLRIHNFSPHLFVRTKALTLLEELRCIIKQWIRSLCHTDLKKQPPRHFLLGAAIAFRLTFDVDDSFLSSALQSEEDASWYIYSNMITSNTEFGIFPRGIRLLARYCRYLDLRLQKHLKALCSRRMHLLNCATSLTRHQLAQGTKWDSLPPPADSWWMSKVTHTHGVVHEIRHINIFDGSYLINGKVSDRLPLDYITHSTFIDAFSNEVSFSNFFCLAWCLK